ncbi:hypothetical protein HTSR_0149 [Halodesulfurarchaeum formicicum]|uniref:Uncharacterized protein n=1 Tax=Halodesulfurarchaeum formicicum TaxID=1873524 RepID=A0A1D8S1X9_9EURY|nr:hypothetical protein [Halodesulfurarchaeum formicicum]AOW79356.1 hypothetical protein HTSR_0149 [Halodesulfurarchaeum formicicum]
MSDGQSDNFDREYLIEKRLLHTEYQEANEEYRHRNKLLHNTFYLLIISIGAFLGLYFQIGQNANRLIVGSLVFLGGLVANVIGNLFLKHYHKRNSAEVVRMHAERIAEGFQDEAIRPFSVEWGVSGAGAELNEADQIVRRGSHLHHMEFDTTEPISGGNMGYILVVFGIIASAVGLGYAATHLTTSMNSAIICVGALLAFVIFYYLARNRSKEPGEDPIY